jgi:hypothetical protein
MKVMIAIPSCHSLRVWQKTIEGTWAKNLPEQVDIKFFLGEPMVEPKVNEVFLKVGDTLKDLTHKVVAMLEWALSNDYDYVFKSDLDTYVKVHNLLCSGFEHYEWSGGQNSHFASGGAGYWLNRRAMEIVVKYPISAGPAEDVNTADALLASGVALHNDPRYVFMPGQVMDDSTITYHLSSVKGWAEKATIEDVYKAHAGTFVLPQKERSARMLRRFR